MSQINALLNVPLSGMYQSRHRSITRLLDLVIAIPFLIIVFPLLVIIGILIRITLGSSIFYYQVRPGWWGKPFTIYKFRTMKNSYDNNYCLLPDSDRLTKLGQFLRNTSLDELPELLNVIKGDMSVVGPRPLLMQYLERYTPDQARRNEVKPGLTGWAQVNGRNAISWEDKFEYDVWYVDNCSVWVDLKIIGMTIWKVLKREGIKQQGHASMEEFLGVKNNWRKL